jgi:hypothetical protein
MMMMGRVSGRFYSRVRGSRTRFSESRGDEIYIETETASNSIKNTSRDSKGNLAGKWNWRTVSYLFSLNKSMILTEDAQTGK